MTLQRQKWLNTILYSLSLIMIPFLWATRAEFLPSLSAFANQHNSIFYELMHGFAIFGYAYHWWRTRNVIDLLVAIGLGGILVFDMYNYPTLHNVITAATFIVAIFNDMYLASNKELPLAIMRSTVGAALFLLGLAFWDVHLFFAEAMAMLCVLVGRLRLVWIKNITREVSWTKIL